MFLGLSNLLTGINNYEQLLELSEKGNNSENDLMINEINHGYVSPGIESKVNVALSLGKLQEKLEFGNIESIKTEDMVQSLLTMVAYNIS